MATVNLAIKDSPHFSEHEPISNSCSHLQPRRQVNFEHLGDRGGPPGVTRPQLGSGRGAGPNTFHNSPVTSQYAPANE